MLRFTRYRGYGVDGQPISISWNQLVNTKLQVVKDKKYALSTGFYELKPPHHRNDNNVLAKHCLVLDFDETSLSFEDLVENLSPYEALIHTTYSHDPEKNEKHYRVIINTDRDMKPEEYKVLYNGFIQNNQFLIGTADDSAQDLSRLFLNWSCPPELQKYARKEEIKGKPIHVDGLLKLSTINQSPPDVKKQIKTTNLLDLLKGGISEGGRNKAFTKFLGHLLNMGFAKEELAELSYRWNQTLDPPMSDEELERTFASILNKHESESVLEKIPEKRYQLLSIKDIKNLPKTEWLVKNLLPAQGLACIYGPSGSSKSFLALDLCLSVSVLEEWFGLKIKRVPVVYLALEGFAGFTKRILAWTKNTRVTPKNFFLIKEDINLSQKSDVNALLTELKEKDFKNGLIVIDTLNQASPGVDENSVKEISVVINHLKLLQKETESLTLIVHHSGKDASKGMRGSSSIRAALDTSLEVFSLNEMEKEFRVDKSKDSIDGNIYKYSLREVDVGEDEEGEAVKSCVIDAGEKRLITKSRPTGKNQLLAYKNIEFLIAFSEIKGKCFQSDDQKFVEVDKAVDYIAKNLITTDQGKRKNQAKNLVSTLLANGYIQTGNDNGVDYLWIK